MAALQKFKLLAIQCGVTQSPTRSPRSSPVVHFRRRKSILRMLLTRTTSRRSQTRREMPNQTSFVAPEKRSGSKDSSGRKLKDLFGSTPPFGDEDEVEDEIKGVEEKIESKREALAAKLKKLEIKSGSQRPGWVGFWHRLLLKKAWRPMLMTIPE